MSDLVARLRAWCTGWDGKIAPDKAPMYGITCAVLIEAADIIEQQAAKIAELEKALKPLRHVANAILSEAPAEADYFSVFLDSQGKSWRVTMDQLRAITDAGRDALAKAKEGKS